MPRRKYHYNYYRPKFKHTRAMTFAEIGRAMGLSAVRVQQIYHQAIAKLRRNPRVMEQQLRSIAKNLES